MANGKPQLGKFVFPAMWTELECHVGLITSCFPAVNQIFQKLVVGDAAMENTVRSLQAAPGMLSVDSAMEQGIKDSDVESSEVVGGSDVVGEGN